MSYRDDILDIAGRIVYQKAHKLLPHEKPYYPEGEFRRFLNHGVWLEFNFKNWLPDIDFSQYDAGNRNITPDGWIVAREFVMPLVEDEVDKTLAGLEALQAEEYSKDREREIKRFIKWRQGGSERERD